MKTHFSASHLVDGYDGSCQNLHGHNWKLKIEVTAERKNDLGISVDFKELKQIVNPVIEKLDHEFLNDLDILGDRNPTAENIAEFIYHKIKEELPESAKMDKITVWETEKYSITYKE